MPARILSEFSDRPAQPQSSHNGVGERPKGIDTIQELEVLCGPLLNYKGLEHPDSDKPTWRGSVLVVTKAGTFEPTLYLRKSAATVLPQPGTNGHINANGNSNGQGNGATSGTSNETSNGPLKEGQAFKGTKLYSDPNKTFWAFAIELLLEMNEARWEYSLPNTSFVYTAFHTKHTQSFVVPAYTQSMRMMFHSCNGFSVGTDIDAWCGPVLWNDVIRMHEKKPFHVMIGGGDQLYNDGVRVDGPLYGWTMMNNPVKRRRFPFNEKMRADCDQYYFNNYVRWYCEEPFSSANGQIPQLNIWDDHDIIDGFGSYTDDFMKCAVFRGIGGVALKYYLLFQHHVPPPISTFTSDAPQTDPSRGQKTAGADPVQIKDTYTLVPDKPDRGFIVGKRPGPYVEEPSRSVYARLGARIAFIGVDARMERTRHRINYRETYEQIFTRLRTEFSASPGNIKHLVVLLGVPIAYPRLVWLENIFNSPLMGGVKFLNKRFGIAGGLFNHFDGAVDLLDDLDDHYCARTHKRERKELMYMFQEFSKEFSVRITILGGDVHLAALGRFYTNLKFRVKPENDHRYMANVISSAITNKPPPAVVANLLARRNFVHHFDDDCDETLLSLFDKAPGPHVKTAASNKVTMPSRNYAILTETPAPPAASLTNGAMDEAQVMTMDFAPPVNTPSAALKTKPISGHQPINSGEMDAGTGHVAASGVDTGNLLGGLDVAIRVELDQHDPEGRTIGYGMSIPALYPPPKREN